MEVIFLECLGILKMRWLVSGTCQAQGFRMCQYPKQSLWGSASFRWEKNHSQVPALALLSLPPSIFYCQREAELISLIMAGIDYWPHKSWAVNTPWISFIKMWLPSSLGRFSEGHKWGAGFAFAFWGFLWSYFGTGKQLLVIELRVQTSGVGFEFLFVAEIQKAAGKLRLQWCRSGSCVNSGVLINWFIDNICITQLGKK